MGQVWDLLQNQKFVHPAFCVFIDIPLSRRFILLFVL